ncbi:MAG: carbohydrate porin, partial [Candidatus Omnitrophica bacterium]|nr:carbohydrate porin [Candidatus Omnitrophota bacterium]
DGGLLYRGLVPGRDEDVSMFGFAYGKWSNALESSQRDDRDTNSSGLDHQEYELMFELSYKMQLRPWLFVQPDIQWIVNPGGRGDIDDALVTGTRIGFVF